MSSNRESTSIKCALASSSENERTAGIIGSSGSEGTASALLAVAEVSAASTGSAVSGAAREPSTGLATRCLFVDAGLTEADVLAGDFLLLPAVLTGFEVVGVEVTRLAERVVGILSRVLTKV